MIKMSDLYGPLDEKKKKRKKAGTESSKESSLRDWFGRKGAKGKRKGWVDCNSPDGKGGYKSCGRSSGEKRKKYPACRPTPGACKERGKGKSWGKKAKKRKNEELYMDLEQLVSEELENVLDEKRKKKKKKKKSSGKKDACYHKVKSRYKVWPSAYASGALVKCRKVGAKNWGNSKKEHLQAIVEDELTKVLQERKQNSIEDLVYYTLFEVLNEKKNLDEDLRKWFGRKGAPGKKKGWVDCNTCRKDKKTGRKKCSACGRSSGEKRSKYPSCRPTPSACGKRGNWGKKSKKGKKG